MLPTNIGEVKMKKYFIKVFPPQHLFDGLTDTEAKNLLHDLSVDAFDLHRLKADWLDAQRMPLLPGDNLVERLDVEIEN
jgi:hypothetical protein